MSTVDSFMPPETVPNGNRARCCRSKRPGREPDRALGDQSMTEYESEDDSSAVECPTCGRDDFASRRGVKAHHAQTHGERLTVTVECAWCGDEKEVDENRVGRTENFFCDNTCRGEWQSQLDKESHSAWKGGKVVVNCAQCGAEKRVKRCKVEQQERHFCDNDCYGEWCSENRRGKQSPAWRGGKTTVECAYCGTEKELQQWELDQSERYFCDQQCQGKWWSERRTGPVGDSWGPGGVAIECAWCGDEKKVKPANAKEFERHFCGFRCLGEWRSKYRSGENHPQWNGGPTPYGENWTDDLKERIREQQNRRCAGCDVHEAELSQKLDVHHIMKARVFDDELARNAESNLIALCRQCHTEWERMAPLRPQTPHSD